MVGEKPYTHDEEIKFTLSIGYPIASHEKTRTVEQWTGLDEAAVSESSVEDIDKELDESWTQWMWEHIDGGHHRST